MADPKQKQNSSAIDPNLDREQGLALQFEDPGLDEILPGHDPQNAPSLTHEVADALEELVLHIAPGEEDSFIEAFVNGLPSEGAYDSAPEAPMIEGASLETTLFVARAEMADRMFELLVVEKSFNDLIETILIILMKASSASAGSILEMDHEKEEFFFRASVGGGDPMRLKSFRVPAQQGIVGHVAESQETLLLNDVDTDARQLRAISLSTGFEINTCLAFPIVVAGRLYGVVELFNKAGGSHFEKVDQQLMEDGSRMAAKVLEVRFFAAELARRMR